MPEQRRVLVVGSNRGLGRGIATAFHQAGFEVVSLNRTLTGEPWLGEVECDVAEPRSIRDALGRLRERDLVLDVCVLNAAVRRLAPVARMSDQDWNDSVAVNLTAPFLLSRGLLPLTRRPGGLLIVIGSHAGTHYFEGGAAYCATKAALKALVEVLLLEERPAGVRAMLVSPGAIANRAEDTSPWKMAPESVGRALTQLCLDLPEDVAVGEIELRPAVLDGSSVVGIERLQRV